MSFYLTVSLALGVFLSLSCAVWQWRRGRSALWSLIYSAMNQLLVNGLLYLQFDGASMLSTMFFIVVAQLVSVGLACREVEAWHYRKPDDSGEGN